MTELDPKVLALVKKHAGAKAVDAITAELKKPKGRRKPAKRNQKHFTEKNVSTLPVKSKQYLVWDTGTGAVKGLAILVSPGGAKSYRCVFQFNRGGKTHWMHLGRVGELSLEEARKRCAEARGRAKEGEDPRDDDPNKSGSFSEAVDLWSKQLIGEGDKNPASIEKTRRVVLNACVQWKDRPIATIRESEIEKLLAEIRDGDGKRRAAAPYMSIRIYAHLKAMFAHAAKKGKFTSPMVNMEIPWKGATARKRPWFEGEKADEAIKLFWKAADEVGGSAGKCLKLLILTGKRRKVTENAKWEDIDSGWIWSPPAGTKNKKNHKTPLSALAKRVIGPKQENGRVFPEVNLEALEAKIKKTLPDFFIHGIRHLTETKLAELKVRPHVRDLMFDHTPKRGAGAGYDHYDYQPEVAEGFELWAEHVEKLVAPKGVRLAR